MGGLSGQIGNLKRLISLRDEFPDAWYELNKPAPPASVAIKLTAQHFPYFAQKTGTVTAVSTGTLSAVAFLDCTVTITQANMTITSTEKWDGNLLVTFTI